MHIDTVDPSTDKILTIKESCAFFLNNLFNSEEYFKVLNESEKMEICNIIVGFFEINGLFALFKNYSTFEIGFWQVLDIFFDRRCHLIANERLKAWLVVLQEKWIASKEVFVDSSLQEEELIIDVRNRIEEVLCRYGVPLTSAKFFAFDPVFKTVIKHYGYVFFDEGQPANTIDSNGFMPLFSFNEDGILFADKELAYAIDVRLSLAVYVAIWQ